MYILYGVHVTEHSWWNVIYTYVLLIKSVNREIYLQSINKI